MLKGVFRNVIEKFRNVWYSFYKRILEAVQQQSLGEFRRQLEYKYAWNGIPLVNVDRFFASSKLCSCCGTIKKDLKLSDRMYHCDQ